MAAVKAGVAIKTPHARLAIFAINTIKAIFQGCAIFAPPAIETPHTINALDATDTVPAVPALATKYHTCRSILRLFF